MLARLSNAEMAIEQLHSENQELRDALSAQEPPKEPEQPKPEEVKEEKKEEKKKEWYDKIKLRGYAQFRYNYLTSQEDGSASAIMQETRHSAQTKSFSFDERD